MTYDYDVIVLGGGIAGLWIGNRLRQAGYNLIVIEKEKLGAGQTLAAQGMIHGGQKYVLQGIVTPHATAAARMPQRWQACFMGEGDVDLCVVPGGVTANGGVNSEEFLTSNRANLRESTRMNF